MTEIPVSFRADGSARTEGTAEAFTYSATSRRNRMIMFIAVGLFAGTLCIVVPGPHMLGAWIPPVLGIWLGLRARSTRAKVLHASGPCPACAEMTQWPGGSLASDPLRVPCPQCRAMVAVDSSS